MLKWLLLGPALSPLLLVHLLSLLLLPFLRGQPLAQVNKCAGGDAVAADDNDNDDTAASAYALATSAPPPAGRHAATYELQCIHLGQKIDAQRNTFNNLEAEIINLDQKTVRALRERDYVRQEAAAQQEGDAAAAAEEAHVADESNFKQVQAAASVQ
eukprot:5805537-Pleurochrysis_carterae.AAC.1